MGQKNPIKIKKHGRQCKNWTILIVIEVSACVVAEQVDARVDRGVTRDKIGGEDDEVFPLDNRSAR